MLSQSLQRAKTIQGRICRLPILATLISHSGECSRHQSKTDKSQHFDVHLMSRPFSSTEYLIRLNSKKFRSHARSQLSDRVSEA
jgi:hypothetical protein